MAYILWTDQLLLQAWRLHFVTQTFAILRAIFVQSWENSNWGLLFLDLLLEDVVIEAFYLLTMLTVGAVVLWVGE